MRWIPTTLVGLAALVMAAVAIAATLSGSSRGERLAGTSTSDVIRGKAGNDTLIGRRAMTVSTVVRAMIGRWEAPEGTG